jgi:hypothetical protein
MSGNKNSGRKPKPDGVRTSVLIDAPALASMRFMAKKEGRSSSAIVQSAVAEYFMAHYEKELEGKINAGNDQT